MLNWKALRQSCPVCGLPKLFLAIALLFGLGIMSISYYVGYSRGRIAAYKYYINVMYRITKDGIIVGRDTQANA